MKLYCAVGTVIMDLNMDNPEHRKLWDGHMNFVASGIAEGWLLCTGPKTAGDGGVLIIRAESVEEINRIFAKDPLHAAGGNRFDITEFEIQHVQPCIEEWVSGK